MTDTATVIIQALSIFIGIWFTTVNVMKCALKHPVNSTNFIIMSGAWTAFITVTWLI